MGASTTGVGTVSGPSRSGGCAVVSVAVTSTIVRQSAARDRIDETTADGSAVAALVALVAALLLAGLLLLGLGHRRLDLATPLDRVEGLHRPVADPLEGALVGREEDQA